MLLQGEAGIGKSRLVSEIHHHLVDEGKIFEVGEDEFSDMGSSQILWFQGFTLSYQSNVAFAPFIDLLRKFFNVFM